MSTPAASGLSPVPLFGDLKKNWGWLLALGILFLILGVVGLGMSAVLTVVGALYFGVLLVIGGGVQLVQSFKCNGWKSVAWHVVIALVYLAAGALIVYDPLGAAIALTLVIAAALVATGVLRLIMSFQLKPNPGWLWLLASGIISIVLGGMIFMHWPISGFWVIGLFIAIELIMSGWSYVLVALAARDAEPEPGSHAAGAA